MPHSLRVRLKNLQRKGELTEKDIDRIFKALEQEPCDKCKYFDGNSCQHYDYKVGYTQGYEDASKRFRQEPCDDVVSRQAVLKAIDDDWICNAEHDYRGLAEEIEQLPSVRPQEPKTGEWIALENRFELGDRLKCSECGQVFVVGDDVSRHYCPNCGAHMVEPQESEDK